MSRVLILGGYGNFGKRIVESLSSIIDITIIITGRNSKKASDLCEKLTLKGSKATLEFSEIDINNPNFSDQLKALQPNIVIHTSGPFQQQSYKVPEACICIGSHYIDLADDRRYVCDITTLNDQAKAKDLLIVSGASSVPGLSSAVIDNFSDQFSNLNKIDFAIAPGNKAERGQATLHAILSYTGHPFKVIEEGLWVDKYGWMSPRKLSFGSIIGKRWLANIDIPDLELFPKRYKSVKTVEFQAGLELPFLHFGMVFMAYLAKKRFINNWSILTPQIFKCSQLFNKLGTDIGGMQINLYGLDKNSEPMHIKWLLNAKNNMGPYIPTIAAIIIAKKLISNTLNKRGACSCLGMFTLKEFDDEAVSLGISHTTETNIG